MILLIDNYDSFTYNLYQLIESLNASTVIHKHDQISIEEIQKLAPEKIILSPGPKTPKEAGICSQVIKHFSDSTPILGVCLGHQCIGDVFGVEIVRAGRQIHGSSTRIYHNDSLLFKNVPNPFKAARYHSLVLENLPAPFQLTAWDKNHEIMAIQHKELPLFGVQFHPESFMTEYGRQLMINFLNV